MTYFNTTQEAPEQVLMFSSKTEKQDDIVLNIIKNLNKPFSAKDIYKRYPIANVPMTSIRRSITTLKNELELIEHIEHGDKKMRVKGLYGRSEYQYKLVE